LSGYHAASHRYWSDQLTSGLPEYDWAVISLPDRHFYWRIRSNALTFTLQHADTLQQHYDLIVATSMVDLCNLRGLSPQLASVPAVLYFHENQFAYPERNAHGNLVNAQLTSLYSAISAQHLLFNSQFNHDSFYAGVESFAAKMPDGLPQGFPGQLLKSAAVIPVPVDDSRLNPLTTRRLIKTGQSVEIVWNHRWEYDKQPQVFFSAIAKLIDHGVDVKLHVMGQSFREVPACFTDFKNRYNDSVQTWGFQSQDMYWQILQQAHLVVSAALHDFQGLGMLEGIMAGCTPVAPDRMAYPEYIPASLLYQVPCTDEADSLFSKLRSVIECGDIASSELSIAADQYRVKNVMPLYKARFSKLIGVGSGA